MTAVLELDSPVQEIICLFGSLNVVSTQRLKIDISIGHVGQNMKSVDVTYSTGF